MFHLFLKLKEIIQFPSKSIQIRFALNIIYKIKDKKVFRSIFFWNLKIDDRQKFIEIFFKNFFFQNFKVTIGIYFEALKLFLKGAKYIQKPKKPKKFFSIN